MIIYPAIFTKQDEGFWVRFPDLEGCLTEGNDMETAVKMAQEALTGYLSSIYEREIDVPKSSTAVNTLKDLNSNEILVMICIDASKCFKSSKSVKKTLTIPSWLNTMADKENVNYSALLQEALKKYLDL